MENYEERYKEALERARTSFSYPDYPGFMRVDVIFPELRENENDRIVGCLLNYFNHVRYNGLDLKGTDVDEVIAWLEKQKDYIKFPNSAYTSDKDVIEFANKYSHTVWGKLMDNFKIIENYSIGCNDVSDIVLNAIINTYNWLEKQGEKKPTLPKWKYKKDHIPLLKDSLILNKYGCVGKSPSGAIVSDVWVLDYDELAKLPKEELEEQGEKKLTDKIEPKFHEDDWIVFNGLILHVDEIVNGYYRTTSRSDGIHNSYDWNIDNAARLWSIQDAKDGDVLLEEETGEPFIYNGNRATYFLGYFLGAYCGIYNGEFNPYGNIHHWGKNSCPATKEQRDLLFQKMKEAGYEWDAEKKELKKMEVVSKESEDERIREQLCDFLRDNMLYQDAQYFISWLEGKKKSADEVMKIRQKAYSDGYIHGQDNIAISLGKESIEALEHFVRSIGESGYASPYDNRTKLVYRLLEQLKKIVNFIHC